MKATTFETQPTEYDAVTLIYGSESVNMTKVTMEHSHVWYADITIAASCKAKFTSGDKTWGGEVFPFGSFVMELPSVANRVIILYCSTNWTSAITSKQNRLILNADRYEKIINNI